MVNGMISLICCFEGFDFLLKKKKHNKSLSNPCVEEVRVRETNLNWICKTEYLNVENFYKVIVNSRAEGILK